jgi:hypothetical protein
LTPVTRNTTRNIHLHSSTNQNTDAIANNSTNGDVNMNVGSNSGSNTKMSNEIAQKYKSTNIFHIIFPCRKASLCILHHRQEYLLQMANIH